MTTQTEPELVPADLPQRDYLFAGLAALLVVFVGLTVRGGPITGVIAAGLGASALVFRWTVMPIVFLMLLAYLLAFPFGLPYFPSTNDTLNSPFRVQDILIVFAVLVYLSCQYRLLGLVHEAMPADVPAIADPPALRPPTNVPAREFPNMLLSCVVFMIVGQVAWFGLISTVVDLRTFPPVRLAKAEPQSSETRQNRLGNMSPPLTRTLLLAGAVVTIVLAARFGFWYWRLARLTRNEAKMLLLDTGWRESRRELNRQEKWRAWGLYRAGRGRGGAG